MDYYKYISSLPSDRLNIFLSTLSVTNRTPEYYELGKSKSEKLKSMRLN